MGICQPTHRYQIDPSENFFNIEIRIVINGIGLQWLNHESGDSRHVQH